MTAFDVQIILYSTLKIQSTEQILISNPIKQFSEKLRLHFSQKY